MVNYIFLVILSIFSLIIFWINRQRNAWDILFFNSTLGIIALFMIGILANNNNVWNTIAIAFGLIITGEKITTVFFKEDIKKNVNITQGLSSTNKNIVINQQNSNNDDPGFFQKISKEQQWNVIKPLLDFYNNIIITKTSVLPLLGALSVAMVVILTLNKDLINFNIAAAKIILSTLLILIPISLLIFIKDVEKGAKGVREDIEKYIGKVETNPNIFDWVASYTPTAITILYFLIVFYFLYVIWR